MTTVTQQSLAALATVDSFATPELIRQLLRVVRPPLPVLVIGVGKSFGVAQLSTSVLQTVGVRATAMHATDVIHGGLNMITAPNGPATVIALSHSGMTKEINVAVRAARMRAVITLIGITGWQDSNLAVDSEYVLPYVCDRDGSRHEILPTVSTIAQLAWINVIACALADEMSYDELVAGHPGGTIGERRYVGRDHIHHTGNGNITIENRG